MSDTQFLYCNQSVKYWSLDWKLVAWSSAVSFISIADKNNLFQDEDGEWEDDDEDDEDDDDAAINGDSNLLLGQFAPASDYPGQQL